MGLPVRKSKVAAPPPACPLTESLALLRGAWAPNVIWYLSAEPRRFGELRHDIPRISARVLSARLRELESRGLVSRRVLATSPPSAEYALTPLGRELLPAIEALASVGRKLIDQWELKARAPRAAAVRMRRTA
jgi:DNA-binding HxlR family transcriptional regulator